MSILTDQIKQKACEPLVTGKGVSGNGLRSSAEKANSYELIMGSYWVVYGFDLGQTWLAYNIDCCASTRFMASFGLVYDFLIS
jgi:hypothetical protein